MVFLAAPLLGLLGWAGIYEFLYLVLPDGRALPSFLALVAAIVVVTVVNIGPVTRPAPPRRG